MSKPGGQPEALKPYQFNSETGRAAGSKSKKETVSLRKILKEFLAKEIPVPGGKGKNVQALRGYLAAQGIKETDKIRTADLLVAVEVQDAISKGVNSSRERIWNYHEGRPAQINITEEGEDLDSLEFVD